MKAILLLCCLLCAPAFAGSGNEAGGGGDAFVAEFLSFGRYLSNRLCREEVARQFPEISCDTFRDKVLSVKLESTDSTLNVDGREVDALNFPSESRIRFNRLRWVQNQRSQALSFGLVMHEFLGLMRINDQDYRISSRLVESIPKNSIELPTSGITLLRRVAHDRFFIPEERESGEGKVALFDFQVSRDFRDIFLQRKRGRLLDGRVISAKVEKDKIVGLEVAKPDAPYGYGEGRNKLKPYKSVALWGPPIGSKIYVPKAVGTPLPDGSLHDGYFRVVARDNAGGKIIKIFTGVEHMPDIFNNLESSVDVFVVED